MYVSELEIAPYIIRTLVFHLNSCCCHLFNQPDLVNQTSQLEEVIASCGHICNFYLKYHCELNLIEQYWGAVKFNYGNFVSHPSPVEEMDIGMS